MDKKGQIAVGAIVMAAVAILIGLAFYTGSFAENVGTMTKTRTASYTITFPANNTYLDLTGQELFTIPTVVNSTGGATLALGNYTIAEGISSSSGQKRIRLLGKASSGYAGATYNVSYDYGAEGYVDDAGGRGIVGLIAIFMALLIMIAAIPDLRNGVVDFIKGK